MIIDTLKSLHRRDLAIQTVKEIISAPEFPFGKDTSAIMIMTVERALREWEARHEKLD